MEGPSSASEAEASRDAPQETPSPLAALTPGEDSTFPPLNPTGGISGPVAAGPPVSALPEDKTLLDHFLQHTSILNDAPDTETRYAWQQGIPHLALLSPPLMHSVLGLGALCLCADIMAVPGGIHLDPGLLRQNMNRLAGLVESAESHHALSVHKIGAAIAEQRDSINPDVILANAALMVPTAIMLRRAHGWLLRTRRHLDHVDGLSTAAEWDADSDASTRWIMTARATGSAAAGLTTMATAINQPPSDTTITAAAATSRPMEAFVLPLAGQTVVSIQGNEEDCEFHPAVDGTPRPCSFDAYSQLAPKTCPRARQFTILYTQ